VQTEAEPRALSESALTAVVNDATALARAELRLVVAEARAWITRAAVGMVLLWFSLLLGQVCVLVMALSPLAWRDHSPLSILTMVAVPSALALVVFALAMRELRRLKALGDDNPNPGQSPRH
jgi:hypothetical protein